MKITNNIQLALKQGSSANQVYEVMIHEGGHALLSNSQVIRLNIKGYENMQAVTAIDIYFENSIGSMKNKYKNLYNQMHDVAVNKISITNPNIDLNKWYKGFKEDYNYIFDMLDSSLLDKKLIYDKLIHNKDIIPNLIETKVLLQHSNFDNSYLDSINSLFDYIKNEDLNLFNEINLIEKSYTKIFEGLK